MPPRMIVPPSPPEWASTRAQQEAAQWAAAQSDPDYLEQIGGMLGTLYGNQNFNYQALQPPAAPVEKPDEKAPGSHDRFLGIIWDEPEKPEEPKE